MSQVTLYIGDPYSHSHIKGSEEEFFTFGWLVQEFQNIAAHETIFFIDTLNTNFRK